MDEIFPQVVFHIGSIPIYDTITSTWVMMVLIALIAWVLGRRRPMVLEMIVEFLAGLASGMMGRSATPYLPLLGALFIFIAVANIIGVVPMMTTPTKDLNTPVALALVVFLSVYYFGIRELGWRGYIRQTASPIFILPLQLIGHVSRTLSLGFRLFGNIFSGDMIVAVIFSIIPLIAPLPLQIFEMLIGLLQAYVFTALASVYIGAAVEVSTPLAETEDHGIEKE